MYNKVPRVLAYVRDKENRILNIKIASVMINILDWFYALRDKTKPFSVREIIGNRLALTAPDYTRLYLGMEEVEKITDANVLLRLGNVECL